MLDMGFIRDIRSIIALLPADARTSSSAPPSRTRSARSPRGCWTGRHRSRSPRATRRPTSCDRWSTRSTASGSASCSSHLVRTRAIDQALVFTRTKHGANKLAEQLLATASPPPPSTATRASRSACVRSHDFKAGRVRCWSRPRSRRAASTSSSCRTSSTSSCRWCRPTTCIASAAPAAPASRATPSRWSASTRCPCCARSSACSGTPIPQQVDRRLRAGSIDPPGADPPAHWRSRCRPSSQPPSGTHITAAFGRRSHGSCAALAATERPQRRLRAARQLAAPARRALGAIITRGNEQR